MIATKLFDPDDGVTYSLIFSKEDAETVVSAPDSQTIELSSIGGSIQVRGNDAAIIYKNGVSGLGTIFSDYGDLSSQLSNGLAEDKLNCL